MPPPFPSRDDSAALAAYERGALRPARPNEARVRAFLAERPASTPADFWEALVSGGILPERALADDRRSFDDPDNRSDHPAGIGATAWPSSLETSVLFASDFAMVERAEELALEVARRLSAWSPAYRVRYVQWRVVGRDTWVASVWRVQPFFALLRPAMESYSALSNGSTEGDERRDDFHLAIDRLRDPPETTTWALANLCWAHRAARAIQCDPSLPPSPFDPLVALWQTGYTARGFTEDTALLVAPSLP